MLEHLFTVVSSPLMPPPAVVVPPVPAPQKPTEPMQATQHEPVPPVPSVPSKKTKSKTKNTLSVADHQKLLAYLAAIGENDQSMIDELLSECAKDPKALAWALQWADKVLGISSQTDDRHYCRECAYLIGGQCKKQLFRPVDDIPRRCADFDPHGGGAGACGVGVMPLGACWWADSVHECVQWESV